jgi:hypothetical protein
MDPDRLKRRCCYEDQRGGNDAIRADYVVFDGERAKLLTFDLELPCDANVRMNAAEA